MFLMISYDVVDDKNRLKLMKFLKDYGDRVQKSVFECNFSSEVYKQVKSGVEKIINQRKDRVRYYRICKGCVDKVEISGWGEVKEEGAKDNQTYAKCKHCGLVCPIPKGGEYPPECIEHRLNKVPEITKKKDNRCPKCGLLPDLCMCEHEDKLKLVNAKDFNDPRSEGCGECEK